MRVNICSIYEKLLKNPRGLTSNQTTIKSKDKGDKILLEKELIIKTLPFAAVPALFGIRANKVTLSLTNV